MIYRNKKELLQRTVKAGDSVLDVGFRGQGIQEDNPKWPHAILKTLSSDVYGIDLALPERYKSDPHYREMSAEAFSFPNKFDVIFAGDLIEHLSNPGLFLQCCKQQLKQGGKLVLTTPSAFNLFNLAGKITKREPSVNQDHTLYFNSRTLEKLLQKNGMKATEIGYLYSLEYEHRESLKKKFLNTVYILLSLCTDKFIETLVVIAMPETV